VQYQRLEQGIVSKGDLKAQWENLKRHNMAMVWLLRVLADPLDDLVVTSIWRPDPTSVHSWYRGVDLRVFNKDRGPEEGEFVYAGQHEEWWEQNLSELSKSFHYDPNHKIYRIHGEGLDRHVHLQTKGTGPWRNDG